ncbi:uncharacterized protein BXZ73DRAFT_45296 [Epithele typhae]|uniref:uncharacterized protein n=1 Tax=Epithele typhae TaxID=378194 RepID=UPI002007E7BF|nr:uncharacterized protein BXZ73DRAFT_45296 [Epithele typhae]KAH9935864.1 hypothetical protein BXZ73DRAFT_45296 [Epithele typhae]
MSLPHAHIVNAGALAPPVHSLLQDDDDDLDDICPVCESECTCPKKATVPAAPLPSAPSTTSFTPSAAHTPAAGKRPLKIKFTVPPNLKSRPKPPTTPTHSGARLGPVPHDAGPSTAKLVGTVGPQSKRRGRPPKALSAKNGTKKKAAADDSEYKARGTTGISHLVRKPHQPPAPAPSSSLADLSDSTLSDYPTFVPAASNSARSSSSESPDSSIDSDSEPDDQFFAHKDDVRHSTKLLPSHVGHKKPLKGGGKWEIKPRKKSVGADEEDDEDSTDSGESDASSEDGDDEEDDDDDDVDADAEADVEGGGMVDADLDDDEADGRIGISFPGTGWSDDDEESSFDADLFFANLDSDSGASSPEAHYADLRAFPGDSAEHITNFSADEEDALLLMDLDPSVQLRRGEGEFEIGVDLDNLFGWDGPLFFSSHRSGDSFGLAVGMQAADQDEDMASVSGSEATSSNTGTVVMLDSDGDTTEDELVDSDGLPNPRAMMLFQWPSTISAINPMSTVSPSDDPPTHASPSTRIALASISSQAQSHPPATPRPADILAGRVSMDDLEDIEMEKAEKKTVVRVRRRRGSYVPVMGNFVVDDVHATVRTAIVSPGNEVPSFYPRPIRIARPTEPSSAQIPPSEVSICLTMSTMGPPQPTESSEEVHEPSQQSYASDASTEAIELDDVLDSSLLDSEPSFQEDTDIGDVTSPSSPVKSTDSPHMHNLSRWDRIPLATFRRTRESATASGVDGGTSDAGMGAFPYRGIGSMMGGMSLFTPPRPLGLDKMSRASARKKKGRHSHGSSPTLLPTRDGVLGSPFVPASGSSSSHNGQSSRSKKDMKREKAMMKKKMAPKSSQHRCQPQRGHNHHPNHKSRATNAVQRTGFSSGAGSSIPSLSI